MSTIDPTALPGFQSTPGASRPQGSSKMGKDEFLRLLVTQLKNQDPTNPMDGQQFAAQLAQFSTVEQLINIDSTLAANGQMNGLLAQGVNSGVAAGLIGKTVEANSNLISWSGVGRPPLSFELTGPADAVQVTVYDENGQAVREMVLDGGAAGKHTVEWDGKNSGGIDVPPGTYTYEVTAATADGKPVEVKTTLKGKVDRVTFGPDGIMLWIGGVAVPMSGVRSVEDETRLAADLHRQDTNGNP
jgi:flagellar basal-body rod modification protein FlgD